MIVKTFVGNNGEELEERIYKLYGPEVIILAKTVLSVHEVEISFGVEEKEFLHHLKNTRNHEISEPLLGEEYEESMSFWDEDTIPDIDSELVESSSL